MCEHDCFEVAEVMGEREGRRTERIKEGKEHGRKELKFW